MMKRCIINKYIATVTQLLSICKRHIVYDIDKTNNYKLSLGFIKRSPIWQYADTKSRISVEV